MKVCGSVRKYWLVLAILMFSNFGFTVQLVSAYDPWGQVQRWQNYNPGSFGFGGGAPMGGSGFQQYGYNYFNPWQGPSFGMGGMGCTLGQYNYTQGPPTVGGGWDGYAYGTFQPGAYGLYGIYGYGYANPFRN